jgi:hypothetical protein
MWTHQIQLTIAVNDNFVKPTVDAIIKGGRSGAAGVGKIGDGKIFVIPLDRAVRKALLPHYPALAGVRLVDYKVTTTGAVLNTYQPQRG